MHIVLSINYSHIVVPMSAEAGNLIAVLEKAKVCKENGYGSQATFTITDEPMTIHLVDNSRVIDVPSKEYSALKDLSAMTTRAYIAETETDKVRKELDALKLKFAPFLQKDIDNAK